MSSDEVNNISKMEKATKNTATMLLKQTRKKQQLDKLKKCLNKKKLRRILKMKKLNQKQNRRNKQGVLKLLNWLNAMIVDVK